MDATTDFGGLYKDLYRGATKVCWQRLSLCLSRGFAIKLRFAMKLRFAKKEFSQRRLQQIELI